MVKIDAERKILPMALKLHVLNSARVLDNCLDEVNAVWEKAEALARSILKLDEVDVVIRHLPNFTIPELAVGGFTNDDGHSVYISVDAKKGFLMDSLYTSLLHELHHAKRFQKLGWTKNLADDLIAEGLACLFEEEQSGRAPIYSVVNISKDNIVKAQKHLFSKKYNRSDWFFGSERLRLPRWFGYTYGYQLCKEYSQRTGHEASGLVDVPTGKIINK